MFASSASIGGSVDSHDAVRGHPSNTANSVCILIFLFIVGPMFMHVVYKLWPFVDFKGCEVNFTDA